MPVRTAKSKLITRACEGSVDAAISLIHEYGLFTAEELVRACFPAKVPSAIQFETLCIALDRVRAEEELGEQLKDV